MGPKSNVWPNFELKIGYKSRSISKLFLVSQQEIDEFENSAQTTAETTTLNEEPIIEMEESCEIDLSPKMDVDRKLTKAQKIQRKTR